MANRMFTITRSRIGEILVLDIASSRTRGGDSTTQIASSVFKVIEESGCSQVLLDTREIQMMTSDVIGQLVMVLKKCQANDIQIKLSGVVAENKLALDLVRLDRMVEMYEHKNQGFVAFRVGETRPVHKETGEGMAVDFFEKAKAGDADAQFRFGQCVETGRGAEQSFKVAMMWYDKAAKQQHMEAQHALGVGFAYGIGVPQDFGKAFSWFERAAQQGHVESQFWVGVSMQHGLVGEVDLTRAIKWYNEAAEQGHEAAREAITELKRGMVPG